MQAAIPTCAEAIIATPFGRGAVENANFVRRVAASSQARLADRRTAAASAGSRYPRSDRGLPGSTSQEPSLAAKHTDQIIRDGPHPWDSAEFTTHQQPQIARG